MTPLLHTIRDVGLAAAARVSPHPDGTGDAVLVIQPDHLGDILLSQPAVRLLRERLSNARLIGVVGPWSIEVARLAWPVDDVVTLSFPGFARGASRNPSAPYRLLKPAAASLSELEPGAAVVLRPDAWWATWLASLVAPVVVAADEPRSGRFATRRVAVGDEEHAAVRAARLATGLAGGEVPRPEQMRLLIDPDARGRDAAVASLRSVGVEGRYAVVHPGSGADVKLWPESRWTGVIRELLGRGLSVVVTGSDSERALCERVASAGGASIAGQTDVAGLLEVMRGAAIAVGTDNGPMHLAVAASTPTVHLFGPSDPRRYGPWGDPRRHRVVTAGWRCPRCGDLGPDRPAGCGCMLAITPDDVVAPVEELLGIHETG